LEGDYDIITVKSCEEALRLLYKGYAPDFILLDLIMPEVDGWDTFERMRAISNVNNVPIAIFTSSDDQKDKDHAEAMGAADFIKKPCERDDLLERIKRNIGV